MQGPGPGKHFKLISLKRKAILKITYKNNHIITLYAIAIFLN